MSKNVADKIIASLYLNLNLGQALVPELTMFLLFCNDNQLNNLLSQLYSHRFCNHFT